jgi:hypothetical protein
MSCSARIELIYQERLQKVRTVGILTAVFVLIFMVVFSSAQEKKPAQQPAAASAASGGQVAHGKYIVEEVAKCINCHTPRDANGEIDQSRLLSGAPVFFQPAQKMPDWPQICPRIGGTPPAPDEDMITLLTTGIWYQTGKPLRQPMPTFHMSREDASAVLAFLKSLKTSH